MTTNAYMLGRKKYGRPQAMLWADNPGSIVDGFHIPDGIEIGVDTLPSGTGNFIILSDDNRSPIDFAINRIEKRERMINGRMRSYHIADKLEVSTSWNMLPSRGFATDPNFDENGKPYFEDTEANMVTTRYEDVNGDGFNEANNVTTVSPIRPSGSALRKDQQYTTDGGAGGVELLDWYEQHQGSFWLYLSYDKYSNYGKTGGAFTNLNKYSQVVEVYFADFNYSVQKRGGTNYDFWNVSVKLEEV